MRWLVVFSLLLANAILLHGAGTRYMRPDENHTFDATSTSWTGTIEAIASDVHAPLYFVIFHGWRQVAGDGEFNARVLAVLMSMLTLAVIYRLGVRWFHSQWAGLAALLALATSAYFYRYTLEIRPYPLLILTGTLCMIAFARWLDRPTWRRTAWWTLASTVLMYTHYLGAFLLLVQAGCIVIMGLEACVRQSESCNRRFLFTPWRQGICAGIGTMTLWAPWFPIFLAQVQHEGGLVTEGALGGIGKAGSSLPTTWPNIEQLILLITNSLPVVVALLLVVSLIYWRHTSRWWLAAAWGLGIPLGLLLINLIIPLYEPRYVAYAASGIALLVGAGIVALPRRLQIPVGMVLLVVGIFTAPSGVPSIIPSRDYLRALAAAFRPGDVLLLDHFAINGWPTYQIEHYAPIILDHLYSLEPMALPVKHLESLDDLPRCVWHVNKDWFNENIRATFDAIEAERPMLQTIGSDQNWLFQRLCAPPQTEPTTFGNEFGFMGLDLVEVQPGSIGALLWWQLLKSPTRDYSFGLYVLAPDGSLVAQQDGPLTDYWLHETINTSAMEPDRLYLDIRQIDVPGNLPPGDYRLSLAVYQPWDGVRLPLVDGSDLLGLLTVSIPLG